MVMAKRWLVVEGLLLAGSAIACGRTDIVATSASATDGSSSPHVIADAAAPATDGAPQASPDLAPQVGPDLAPQAGPDLAPQASPDLAPDLRTSTCGNARLDPGEGCDDGNTYDGDGCSSRCVFECNWEPCPWPPITVVIICGDGVRSAGEECDDGNTHDGDGCSDICQVERGFRCVMPGRPCTPTCGDRLIVGKETCDDGNTHDGDGCSEFCLTEPCWDCGNGACSPRPPAVDGGGCRGLPVALCGDGIVQGAEECDEGAANDDAAYDGCSSRCRYLTCGDGIVNGTEECDLGYAANTSGYGVPDGCTRACTLPHYCGDGIIDADQGEQCDLGAANNGVSRSCTSRCVIWLP